MFTNISDSSSDYKQTAGTQINGWALERSGTKEHSHAVPSYDRKHLQNIYYTIVTDYSIGTREDIAAQYSDVEHSKKKENSSLFLIPVSACSTTVRAFRAAKPPMDTWSSCPAEVGMESTEEGCVNTLSSDTGEGKRTLYIRLRRISIDRYMHTYTHVYMNAQGIGCSLWISPKAAAV